ncbi:regulator of phenolic acid metabolism PadR [Lactobacillus selangorensis]|uniref:Regulator of phenolic acid metabolism PadR n=1 Tax=Lactobacillus selangorensis TaxID=81857 RepID=A0A0R2FS21_9LACO|nr:PadR family transcriptional regulator [Lactobacillus selangorensis]KRN28230.1 regulator of phenolic acid metabolism PadR [Lactobacillus selangorensis]KRN30894.1 regulator of phenolic acid metabolism PadR [Lactobacillus selangorensis]
MAQRNTLKYIILGLINERPVTGYELTKAFDSDIGEFWLAQHSQIYPLLKRMEHDQLITHQLEVTGEKLERKRYAITPDGQQELADWLNEPVTKLNANKDEFILKLYFIRDRQDGRLLPMLTTQLQLHQQKRNHLQDQMAQKFPDAAHIEAYGHFLILQHAISREQDYCQWLTNTISNLTA